MFDKIKILSKATVKLAWALVAGPLGRCHHCGTKRIVVELPTDLSWLIDGPVNDDGHPLFCPKCEGGLLEQTRRNCDLYMKGMN